MPVHAQPTHAGRRLSKAGSAGWERSGRRLRRLPRAVPGAPRTPAGRGAPPAAAPTHAGRRLSKAGSAGWERSGRRLRRLPRAVPGRRAPRQAVGRRRRRRCLEGGREFKK
ncbi:hypothetical protein DIPPA_21726 [Diplonema papillatum]|nr:hypothetical protein DIPPA_21726 [Diplonema papillatum]